MAKKTMATYEILDGDREQSLPICSGQRGQKGANAAPAQCRLVRRSLGLGPI